MRQVQLEQEQDHFLDLVDAAEAGETLTLVRGGRPVAQIIPFLEDGRSTTAEAERQEALRSLRAIMNHGYDLGGLKVGSRDELYDRD